MFCSCLISGDAKLAEIGLQVGYETDAAFNKAFKRVIGATPGQYRNAYLDQRNPVGSLSVI